MSIVSFAYQSRTSRRTPSDDERDQMQTVEMKPADIILQQLGGARRLAIMIGAKDFFSDDNGATLIFRFAMCETSNRIRIKLNGLDLYDVKFEKVGRLNRKTFNIPVSVAAEFENVYAEDLKGLIERETGLYLSM